MPNDPLKQFATLHAKLTAECARLEARLAEINATLGTAQASPAESAQTARRGVRTRNAVPLAAAVAQATANKPLTKSEIMEALKKQGYRFSTKNPVNSLNTVLYGSKKPKFKNDKGRFSPA